MPADLTCGLLRHANRSSFCECNGHASYRHLVARNNVPHDAVWHSAEPRPAFATLQGRVASYAGPLDRCTVDAVPAQPQPAGSYGRWITPDFAGPFEGVPASMGR